jgi:environmental stress-induced protein Ves
MMPWKNGGGMTSEIVRGDAKTKNRDWGWRVSIAVVETNSPFSIFKGIERTMSIIEGNGMDLDSPDGKNFSLDLFKVVKFDGETALKGRLRHGSVKNFNVMVDRNLFTACLEIINTRTQVVSSVEPNSIVLIHQVKGEVTKIKHDQNFANLAAQETIVFESNKIIEVQSPSNTLLVIVRINKKSN